MTRAVRFGALILSIAAIGALAQPVQILAVETRDENAIVCRRVDRGSTVTLVFTHSMYGGEVRETWRVDGDSLDRVRIVTDNAAAAEYYATDGRIRRVGGGFEVIVPPARIDRLPFRIDHIGNHRLRFDGEDISLAHGIDGSAGADLTPSQTPLIAWLVNANAGCER